MNLMHGLRIQIKVALKKRKNIHCSKAVLGVCCCRKESIIWNQTEFMTGNWYTYFGFFILCCYFQTVIIRITSEILLRFLSLFHIWQIWILVLIVWNQIGISLSLCSWFQLLHYFLLQSWRNAPVLQIFSWS